MFRPRVIPTLLLKNAGLVKTVKFNKYRYIGDPINAVKIFNDLKADELVFLDIDASLKGFSISPKLIKQIGEEANMPFAVGGGINSLDKIREVLSNGAEKVVISTKAFSEPSFIKEAANQFGSSTIVISIDYKYNWFNKPIVRVLSGKKATKFTPLDAAKFMEENGAGEIIIHSIDRDGTMDGYDYETLQTISESVSIPVVALGGAGSLDDLVKASKESFASAVAAGSLFVYHGSRNAVLVNYPTREKLNQLLHS